MTKVSIMPSENQKRNDIMLSIIIPLDHISDNQNRSQKGTRDNFPGPQRITYLGPTSMLGIPNKPDYRDCPVSLGGGGLGSQGPRWDHNELGRAPWMKCGETQKPSKSRVWGKSTWPLRAEVYSLCEQSTLPHSRKYPGSDDRNTAVIFKHLHCPHYMRR